MSLTCCLLYLFQSKETCKFLCIDISVGYGEIVFLRCSRLAELQ